MMAEFGKLLEAEGLPLRHVLLGWPMTLSGGEKEQAGGLDGAKAEEKVNTATHYAFFYSNISARPPCMVGNVVSFGTLPFSDLTARSVVTPEVLHQRTQGAMVCSKP